MGIGTQDKAGHGTPCPYRSFFFRHLSRVTCHVSLVTLRARRAVPLQIILFSSLVTRHSQGTVRRAPTDHSFFVTRHSLFQLHHSSPSGHGTPCPYRSFFFVTRHSLFQLHHSSPSGHGTPCPCRSFFSCHSSLVTLRARHAVPLQIILFRHSSLVTLRARHAVPLQIILFSSLVTCHSSLITHHSLHPLVAASTSSFILATYSVTLSRSPSSSSAPSYS